MLYSTVEAFTDKGERVEVLVTEKEKQTKAYVSGSPVDLKTLVLDYHDLSNHVKSLVIKFDKKVSEQAHKALAILQQLDRTEKERDTWVDSQMNTVDTKNA